MTFASGLIISTQRLNWINTQFVHFSSSKLDCECVVCHTQIRHDKTHKTVSIHKWWVCIFYYVFICYSNDLATSTQAILDCCIASPATISLTKCTISDGFALISHTIPNWFCCRKMVLMSLWMLITFRFYFSK